MEFDLVPQVDHLHLEKLEANHVSTFAHAHRSRDVERQRVARQVSHH